MLFVVACGGDKVTPPGDSLSADQVQSMAGALRSLIALSLFPEEARLAPPANVRGRTMSLSNPITGSRACPMGGYLGVDGSFSPDDSGHIVFALSDTLVGCAIKDNELNVWTFDTEPTLEISAVEGFENDSANVSRLTIRETDVGRLSFVTGTLSGSCSMDVVIQSEFSSHSPTADSNTVAVHTTGSLCGRSLASDTSITTAAPTPP